MPFETGCLAFIVYVQWWREQYRKFDPWIMRVLCMALFMTGVDTMIAIYLFDDGYGDYDVSIFVRPVVILALIRNLRLYSILFVRVVKDSYPMVAFISVYVLYFSWIALIWFRGTLQGTQYFDNFLHTLYHMFVLFTASNSPDVYLPSYETERSECIFFIVYMFIGIFLLNNLLLATIADSFSNSF